MAWIGLYRPSPEELRSVADEFGLHPVAVVTQQQNKGTRRLTETGLAKNEEIRVPARGRRHGRHGRGAVRDLQTQAVALIGWVQQGEYSRLR